MKEKSKLPRGIRNNNPGNLRGSVSPEIPTHLADGFAVFDTIEVGVGELMDLICIYYNGHGLRTVNSFISRYAPATENDVLSYVNIVCAWMRIPPAAARTQDMRLDCLWNAIDLARAIIHVENGRPPSGTHAYPEWISIEQFSAAIDIVRGWDDATWSDGE